MVRTLHGFCCAALLVICQPAAAQTADSAPFTLVAAIDEALANNPVLVAARLEVEAARQGRAQEGYLVAPTLEAQIWQWPLSSLNPLNTDMYMFTARQDIPGAGKRALRAAVADRDIDRASVDIALRARDVVNDIKQAFTRVFVGRQAVVAHQASVELLHQTADLRTVRYSSGEGTQRDILASVAEIGRLRIDILELESQVQLASAALNTLLNRPPGAPLGELAALPVDAAIPSVNELQRLALEHHPELAAARIDIERGEAAVAIAERDYKPDFMVGGGYQLMPRSAGAWTVTVGMTWPSAPWSRGRLDAAKAQASAEVATAKARHQVVVNAIAGQVQQAHIRAMTAQAQVQLLQSDVIPRFQQVLASARVAYQSDRGDASAVIEDQRRVVDAQVRYFRTLGELQQARADLEYAVGVDLEERR